MFEHGLSENRFTLFRIMLQLRRTNSARLVSHLTLCKDQARYTDSVGARSLMDDKTDFGTIAVAVCVAAYAALMLACAAYDLGLPAAQTRHLSVVAALFLALPVAFDFLRTAPDKAR